MCINLASDQEIMSIEALAMAGASYTECSIEFDECNEGKVYDTPHLLADVEGTISRDNGVADHVPCKASDQEEVIFKYKIISWAKHVAWFCNILFSKPHTTTFL